MKPTEGISKDDDDGDAQMHQTKYSRSSYLFAKFSVAFGERIPNETYSPSSSILDVLIY